MTHLILTYLVLQSLTYLASSENSCGDVDGAILRHSFKTSRSGNYQVVYCEMGQKILLFCTSEGHWRIEENSMYVQECPRTRCKESELGTNEFHTVTPGRMYLNNIVTIGCVSGYVGRPIRMRCQKRRCNTQSGCRLFWKPLNRTADGQKIRTVSCSAPEGEVRCPPFQLTDHMTIVERETERGHPVYMPYDALMLGCEQGYHLEPVRSDETWIECNDNGTWGPSPIPICTKDERKETCELPRIGNSNFQSESTNFTKGAWATVECAKDYMINRYSLRSLLCVGQSGLYHGGWDRSIPRCEAITCPNFSIGRNGLLTFSNRRRRDVGTTATVMCNEGYTLRGPRVRWCTEAATWNGTLQVCDGGGTTCGNPGTPIHGRKIGDRYNEGDVVTFSCNRGYVMIGAQERTCLARGTWTGKETRCYGRREYMTVEEVSRKLQDGIGRLSMETGDSVLFQQKMQGYLAKDIQYGKHDMKDKNPDMRTSLGELRDEGGLDVYFVIDTSGSISRKERRKSVDIAKALVKRLGVARPGQQKGGTGVGLVAFNSTAWRMKLVSELTSVQQVHAELDKIAAEGTGGGTAPSKAFEALEEQLIPTARITEYKKTIAIVMLTDGIVNEGGDPRPSINSIKDMAGRSGQSVHIYCLGVGDADLETLKDIASEGEEYLMKVKGYETFLVVSRLISNRTDFSRCGLAGPGDISSSSWAERNVWRWMGAMYKADATSGSIETQMKDHKNKFHCGVSLLKPNPTSHSSRWALTAAHCVKGYKHTPNKLIVKFGSINSSKISDDNPTLTFVDKIEEHGDYISTTMESDVALLRLKAAIQFSVDIRPVCLPAQGPHGLMPGKKAVVTGWGYWNLSITEPSEDLKQIDVEIQSEQTCNETSQGTSSVYVSGQNLCAGGVRNAKGELLDACKKDSGGPLMVSRVGTEGLTTWTQAGIVSWGEGCSQPGKYGVYTSVSHYADWIKNIIKHG